MERTVPRPGGADRAGSCRSSSRWVSGCSHRACNHPPTAANPSVLGRTSAPRTTRDSLGVWPRTVLQLQTRTFRDSQSLLLFSKATERSFQGLRHHFFATGSQQWDICTFHIGGGEKLQVDLFRLDDGESRLEIHGRLHGASSSRGRTGLEQVCGQCRCLRLNGDSRQGQGDRGNPTFPACKSQIPAAASRARTVRARRSRRRSWHLAEK